MEDIKKKKKLTLTISSKKTFNAPSYTRDSNKKSVIIEKKISRKKVGKSYSPTNKSTQRFPDKAKFFDKKLPNQSEIRKIAEERATKRFKTPDENILTPKKGNINKNKSSSKREYKLTLSKAADEDAMEGRERSLASVRRARLKEKKTLEKDKTKVENKKIVH